MVSVEEVTRMTTGSRPRATERVEWQTLALAAVIHGGWIAALVLAATGWAPMWVWLPMAIWFVGWESSLQHEVVHGHPTPWKWVNRIIAGPPFLLWLSYWRYEESHLKHHVNEHLTDPLEDPESYYLTEAQWAEASSFKRAWLTCMNCVIGRMVLGSLKTAVDGFVEEWKSLFRSGKERRGALSHWAQVAVIVACLYSLFGVEAWTYLLLVMWPASGLMLVRSFMEHRPALDPEHRTIIVDSRGPLAWLFLFNNLHAVHHAKPGLPWYRLREEFLRNRDDILTRNGEYVLRDYGQMFARYALRIKDAPVLRASNPKVD